MEPDGAPRGIEHGASESSESESGLMDRGLLDRGASESLSRVGNIVLCAESQATDGRHPGHVTMPVG